MSKHLEEAVATVLGASKSRQLWLKRSLRTKDEKRAKVLAKPVMMEFDRVIADAEALLVQHPLRTSLTETEIKQETDAQAGHGKDRGRSRVDEDAVWPAP